MEPPRTDSVTLVAALRILARDIQSDDGVANACIAEAADEIERLVSLIRAVIKGTWCVTDLQEAIGDI